MRLAKTETSLGPLETWHWNRGLGSGMEGEMHLKLWHWDVKHRYPWLKLTLKHGTYFLQQNTLHRVLRLHTRQSCILVEMVLFDFSCFGIGNSDLFYFLMFVFWWGRVWERGTKNLQQALR